MSDAPIPHPEHLLRTLAPQVLGALVRRYGDFCEAEDAVQEALISAARQWPTQGRPEQPLAWLIQVAARRLTDQRRSAGARRRRENAALSEALADEPVPAPDCASPERDDTLLLLFMCCHPALTRTSAIALTLRAVGGLTTAQIARAFLVPEATMAQRISRAKQVIQSSGVAFKMPTVSERDERLAAVLHVLYLMFNEGYGASSGQSLQRVELSDEAIRLARELWRALPQDGEVAGLLALMLLTDARRRARSGPDGELIPLDEQDRSLWDRALIAEGTALISEALSRSAPGSYQLQAAIAALHDEASSVQSSDWPQILALYELLASLTPNPMVSLNAAIAAAMVHGPGRGLELLEPLRDDPRISQHHLLFAARGHLLERAGEVEAAISELREAALRTSSAPERDYLLMKAAKLVAGG